MQRLNDIDVIRAIANATPMGATGEITVEGPATLRFKFVRDANTGYAVFESDALDDPIVFRLFVTRAPQTKEETRSEARQLLDAYIANGRQITQVEPRKGSGHTARDWDRLQKGLKVATPEEIKAERDRRALKAIANKDNDLVLRLLTGKFDREIKFDIENDRLGPNGEIR